MSESTPAFRRAYRDTQQPVLGGVAAGLARHLGLPVLWVRAGFVLLTVLGGSGVVFYGALWLFLPAEPAFAPEAPGLESAARSGKRPRRARRLTDAGPAIALGALGIGVVLLLDALLGTGGVWWPLGLGLAGVALLWRQADEAQRERWLDTTGRLDPFRAVFGAGGWAAYARVAAGLALVVTALVVFALRSGNLRVAWDLVVAGLLGIAGLAIVVGPWVYRLATDLAAERAERVRTQERADLAAHLHDSVLQTLALIQKNAADGPTVARLARAQERDLRSWLYDVAPSGGATVATALRAIAAEVEDDHEITVDLVTVGDCPLDEKARPGGQRHPRGRHQRRQARRHRPGRRLRRGHRRRDRGLRPRPGCGLRPGRRTVRPVRRPQQHPRPDGAARRLRRGAHRARPGHRGPAAAATRREVR